MHAPYRRGVRAIERGVQRAVRVLSFGALALSFAGCFAAKLPGALSADDSKLAAATTFPYRVAVARDERPRRSDATIAALRGTKLFLEVDYEDRLSGPAQLRATGYAPSGTAVIPLFTIVSLGIVPTVFDEAYGYTVDFASADPFGQSASVTYVGRGKAMLGWGALALRPLPSWSGATRKSRRVHDHLRLAIVKRADEVKQLAERGR